MAEAAEAVSGVGRRVAAVEIVGAEAAAEAAVVAAVVVVVAVAADAETVATERLLSNARAPAGRPRCFVPRKGPLGWRREEVGYSLGSHFESSESA